MDKEFPDHNAMNTLSSGKTSMELEQSGQNICVTVKGMLGSLGLLRGFFAVGQFAVRKNVSFG